jgi:lipopolysaccharide transport system permease protein
VRAIVREIWLFRSLTAALVRRHISTRYRGSAFGFLWSLMNPLCLMAVYTLVFQYYMRFQGGPYYHLTLFAGLLPWICTTTALSEGTSSLVNSGHLITKSLFPPQVLPVVSVASAIAHFVLALPILALFILGSGAPFHWTWILAPLVVLLHGLFLVGIVLSLSALNVFYRDVQHLVGNLLTFLFFLCPVVYPASTVPEKFRILLALNPFATFTQWYQGILIEGIVPTWSSVAIVTALTLLAVAVGSRVHSVYHERFAEVL